MKNIQFDLMMTCCRKAVRGWDMLGVSVRQMKALTVKIVTVTLNGKDMKNLTCFVY